MSSAYIYYIFTPIHLSVTLKVTFLGRTYDP
jgi:hypothetical protein